MRRGVYFTGKNLGRVVDSEDEDEDLQADDVTVPEEFLTVDAEVNVAAPDHGESETGCNLGRSKSIVKVGNWLSQIIHSYVN